jgi:hypothetical protein
MKPECARRLYQALVNHRRPPRTPGEKVRDAIEHTKHSELKTPAGGPGRVTDLAGCRATRDGHCYDEL